MRKFILTAFFILFVSFVGFSQAKKPKLMIIPATTWCNQNGFVTEYVDMSGKTEKTPDYQRAFDENEYVAMIIGAMQDFMNNEGYEVVDLQGALGSLKNDAARDNLTTAGGGLRQSPIDMLNKTAKADINVELHYAIKRDGPYKYLEFNVAAKDAYSNKPISTGNIGRGTSASSTNIVNQLGEAVLSFKDKFINDMDQYYNRLFENGRQIVVRCTLAEDAGVDYETEIDGEELGTLIENWIAEHTMKGNYSLSDSSENELLFDDVRIPMTYVDPKNGNTRGTDARWLARDLEKYIRSITGEKCKIDVIGLGKVNLILGGKS
ncbi:MAG: hypothetical protein K2K68_06095 [Duncaniella sp.]|nr:hypothetical protein [Duncaniella sp.]